MRGMRNNVAYLILEFLRLIRVTCFHLDSVITTFFLITDFCYVWKFFFSFLKPFSLWVGNKTYFVFVFFVL